MKKLLFLLLLFPALLFGQPNVPLDWFHLDPVEDKFRGLNTSGAYDLLGERDAQIVIVAILDSGIDIDHEDLRENIWTNPGEIANSGRDDDGNGYIDDIHGWNFIGGPDGDVINDNLEITRLYRKFRDEYSHLNPLELNRSGKLKYAEYLTYKRAYNEGRENALENYERMKEFRDRLVLVIDKAMMALEDKPLSEENLMQIDADGNMDLTFGINVLLSLLEDYDPEDFDEFRAEIIGSLDGGVDHYESSYKYHYNVDYDPRYLVNDNYEDPYERYYGNSNVGGAFSQHGTHVAGIIGAVRNNGTGMDGVAKHVRLMPVRTVPDGDERDKDVANAIRYAVDNGAKIINMSFGKGYSWNKQIVDEAVRYAEKNDVLLVHAAGNSSQNNDLNENYPNPNYEQRRIFAPRQARNWIEVGALNYNNPPEKVASFSNYGKETVDVFAPGNFIYSTVPGNEYEYLPGTSMAAPMVSGLAAILRSYFPELSAREVKDIILQSAIRENVEVYLPGTRELVPFSDLSQTGAYINAYEAVKLAIKKTE